MYKLFLRIYLGFQVHSKMSNDLQSLPKGSPNDQMDHKKGYKGPVARRSNIPNVLKEYPGSQSSFQGGEPPPIAFLGPLKEQMDLRREDKGLRSSRIGCTKFIKDVPRVPSPFQDEE